MSPPPRLSILSSLILAVAFTACTSATPTPTPTATPTPTSTPMPAPTPTEAPTSTPIPTATPMPTPTPTPEPSPTPTPSPTPAPTSTPLPTATPTPTPVVSRPPVGKPGGKLTTLALVNVPNLDVHQVVQETLTALGPGIAYSRLLRLRTGPADDVPQPSLRLECDLCESWQMVDLFTYRFQLRQGVRWHNRSPVDGRELTADDLVFSYERQRTPGWANAPLLQDLDTVEAEGPYSLKLSLKPGFPNADFLIALADGHSKVVAREVVDEWGSLERAPVIGTGPWKLKSVQEDQGSVFVKNPDYFEDGLPFLDELEIRVIRDETTGYITFRTGGVDIYRISPFWWRRLKDTPEASFDSFLSNQGGSGVVLTMNVSRPPFDNRQVRRAVFRAVDPWDYVRTVWGGQGFVSLGMPVQEPDWNLSMEEMRAPHFANPTDASRLLEESANSLPMPFELTVADFGDLHLALGSKLEEDLRSVGFDPLRVNVNSSLYQDKVWRDKDYDLAIGELPPTSSLNSFLFGILHSGSPTGNLVGHADAELDSLIEQQSVEGDLSRRRSLVRELQQRVLDQAYMFAPVTSGSRWVFGPDVRGFFPNTAASEYFYWAKAWRE